MKYFFIEHNRNGEVKAKEEDGIVIKLLYYGKLYSFGGVVNKHGTNKYPDEIYYQLNITELTTGYLWYKDTFDRDKKPKISSQIIKDLCIKRFGEVNLTKVAKAMKRLRPQYLKAMENLV